MNYRFSRTKLQNGYTEVIFVYRNQYRLLLWLLITLLCSLTLFRETIWRIKPEVFRDCGFTSSKLMYQGRCRFIYGKWFGKKHNSPIIKTSGNCGYGL